MRTGACAPRQHAIRRALGSRHLRSSESLVRIGSPVRRAQITTWASAMSAVRLAASRIPTWMASAPSRGTTRVSGCRTRRDKRACRSGCRTTCASAVAGTVIRAPISCARTNRAIARRSFRSSAIKPPASNVIPFTRPCADACASDRSRARNPPRRAPSWSADRRSVRAHARATAPSLPRP